MDVPLDWLLEGEPWVAYRARLDLMDQSEQQAGVLQARARLLASPQVQHLIAELTAWPGIVIASHKSAGQLFHKLAFAADLGLKAGDPGLDVPIGAILRAASAEGPFTLPVSLPQPDGSPGPEQAAWALCDAPLTAYALAHMGLQSHPAVEAATVYLAGLARENGWPCAVSKELGGWRGPGRKGDPCPFATLAMLKLLSIQDAWRDCNACHAGAEALLQLWEESNTQHPYQFYMGTDFRKLKVPFIWYDLMHVLEVLTRFPWLRDDPRLRDMLAVLKNKMDSQGRFTLESVWTAWKDWEFGQKKQPSRWLTLLAWRIIRRAEGTPA